MKKELANYLNSVKGNTHLPLAKLREELIKDIVSYLDKSVIDQDVDYIDVQNTITQIIVDTFDEYEYDTQQARLYTEDIKAQDRELNLKNK